MAWTHSGDVIHCPSCDKTWSAGSLVPCVCDPDPEITDAPPPEYQVDAELLDSLDPAAQAILTFDGCLVALAQGWLDLGNSVDQTAIKKFTCRLQYLKRIREMLHEENTHERTRALERGNAEVRDLHAVAGGSAERDDISTQASDHSGAAATRRH